MNTLPNDVIRATLYELSVKEIMSLCSTNQSMQSICQDERFWKQYILLNYNIKNPSQKLAKLAEKEIIIYKNGKKRKMIITEDMSLRQILDEVDLIVPNNTIYSLDLKHPFKQDNQFIQRIGTDIYYYNERFRSYDVYFNSNLPIGKILYTMLFQIDTSA